MQCWRGFAQIVESLQLRLSENCNQICFISFDTFAVNTSTKILSLLLMFEKLKAKWKVDGTQLFLILCTFAVTGTLTAWISRSLPGWLGFTDETHWGWKLLVRLIVLIFGYQVIILIVSVFFGQFKFFWNYEKKILRWLSGRGRV